MLYNHPSTPKIGKNKNKNVELRKKVARKKEHHLAIIKRQQDKIMAGVNN